MRAILAVLCLATGLVGGLARAGELKILTAGAFKPVVLALVEDFERQSGHKLLIDNDTAGALSRRIGAGEAFDLAIVTPGVIRDLVDKGRIAAGTPVDLARTSIGVAVKEGAAKPAIATVADFKATLLAAGKIAYIDPAAGGSSGIYFAKLIETMGIAEAVKAKAVLVPGGLVAEKLVTGEADLAVHQISEILAVKGVTLVGPLPAEIQNVTTYSGGIGAKAAEPEIAKAFLAFLVGEPGRRVLAARGMEPPSR